VVLPDEPSDDGLSAVANEPDGDVGNVGNVGQVRVDVLIPVYEGREHALACIHSVIEAQPQNQTLHDIVVLDDASQDPTLRQSLNDLANNKKITLIQRPANLGFIRNINRGMARQMPVVNNETQSRDSTPMGRDVVWLNADTRVTGDWLDRLRTTAYMSTSTASVTPWSQTVKALDLPAQTLVSGCGFCFYVKRQALDKVGYLDELAIIDGYGEETDWCMRARELGWQHMGAANVFVAHEGGQSFGARKQSLAKHNNSIIRERYPLADRIHDAFRDNDPLQPLRVTIAAALKTRGIELQPTKNLHEPPAEFRAMEAPGQAHPDRQPSLQKPSPRNQSQHQHEPGPITLADLTVKTVKDLTAIGNGLGIIVDDLRDADTVNAWLALARQIRRDDLTPDNSNGRINIVGGGSDSRSNSDSDNIIDDSKLPRLLIGQDTPGSLLLEKTGVAMRIGCPAGLAWSQWLPLLGVTHSVSLNAKQQETAATPKNRQTKTAAKEATNAAGKAVAKKAITKSLARTQRAEQAQALA